MHPQSTEPQYRVTFDSFSLAPIMIPADSTDHEIAERIYDVLVDDGFNDIEVRVNRPAGTFTVYDGIDDVLGRGRVHEPEPDYWLTLAEDVHRAAVRIATLAGTGRKPTYVSLNIQLARPGNTDPTVSADIDTVAAAFGVEAKSAKGAGGYYEHSGRTNLGDLNINPYGYVPAPEDPEKAALAARVAELEARLAEGGATR